jgi:hypothetical protein
MREEAEKEDGAEMQVGAVEVSEAAVGQLSHELKMTRIAMLLARYSTG